MALLGELAAGTEDPHFASVDPELRTTRARHELAVGLWGLGRREEAVGNWETAVGHNPRFLPAWAGLAGALLAAGAGEKERAGAALAAMRALPEPGPTEADVLESSSLSASGRHREAAAMLSAAAARDSRSGALRRLLGIALLAAGDAARARVELLEALRLDPTDREAFEAVRNLGD